MQLFLVYKFHNVTNNNSPLRQGKTLAFLDKISYQKTLLLPVHCWNGMISDIVANSYSAVEKFHGQMFMMPVVYENTIFLGRRKYNGNIRFRFRPQRLQFHVRSIVNKAETCKIFTSLT